MVRRSLQEKGPTVLSVGLTDSDFDAYLPARASSNVYTRPRLEVKQKLLGLSRPLQQRAAALGLALEARASDERPSVWNKHQVTAQWLFLWRDADARRHLEAVLEQGRALAATLSDPTPFYRHAFIAVCVDATGVEVALKVHADAAVDVKNLRARLADPVRRAELLQALWAARDVSVGVTDGPTFAAKDLDGVRLTSTLDALSSPARWWFVRALRVERADAVARGASLGDEILRAFEALVPLYRLVAWSPESDLVSVEAEIARAEADRAAHEREAAVREAAWHAQHEAEIQRAREAAEARSHERAAAQERARPAVVSAAVQGIVRREEPAPPREERKPIERKPAPPRSEPRAAAPKPSAPKPSAPKPSPAKPASAPATLAVGVRVKVERGPFAGRVGTVIDLDGKGFAKVNFGLLSARVELAEIAAVAG